MGIHGWNNKNINCHLNNVQAPHGTAFVFVGTKGGRINNNTINNNNNNIE